MIKPILPFLAVLTGSAYPKQFTPDDVLEAHSEAAEAALNLGCLSDEDAALVRAACVPNDVPPAADKAQGTETDAKTKTETDTKAEGNAPENKSSGVKT